MKLGTRQWKRKSNRLKMIKKRADILHRTTTDNQFFDTSTFSWGDPGNHRISVDGEFVCYNTPDTGIPIESLAKFINRVKENIASAKRNVQ